ncbi:hypothetical protein [Streptomyces sp. WAC08241]|nr:hypothetical protein [Streptomyces sp. WAC08241]
MLDEKQLAHAMFPLGDTLTTKDEIRAEAERRGRTGGGRTGRTTTRSTGS